MKVGSKRTMLAVGTVTVAWLVGVGLAATGTRNSTSVAAETVSSTPERTESMPPLSMLGSHSSYGLAGLQAAAQGTQAKPPMAEEVFKNIQVLKGITAADFMGTMGIMSASLGFCCAECHTGAGTETVKWEADTARKRTARRMVTMVQTINKENFAGRQVVTCWTCHRGVDRPLVTPDLDTVYGEAKLIDYDIVRPITGAGGPTADQIIDKYLQTIGGAQRLASVTSYTVTAKGVAFGGFGGGAQVEIFAKAPDQRATYIHFEDKSRGDSLRTFDGRTGWIRTPLTILGEYQLFGGELAGAKLDAQLAFPAQIKQVLTNLRVGVPFTIGDKDCDVVQGNAPGGVVASLYFDRTTGMLARYVRYTDSPIGRVPTQIDFADYRDVGNGVKMPYRWTFAWLDGRDGLEWTAVKVNAPIEAARFGKPPAGPAAPTAR